MSEISTKTAMHMDINVKRNSIKVYNPFRNLDPHFSKNEPIFLRIGKSAF
jgi:hypothetical protein